MSFLEVRGFSNNIILGVFILIHCRYGTFVPYERIQIFSSFCDRETCAFCADSFFNHMGYFSIGSICDIFVVYSTVRYRTVLYIAIWYSSFSLSVTTTVYVLEVPALCLHYRSTIVASSLITFSRVSL